MDNQIVVVMGYLVIIEVLALPLLWVIAGALYGIADTFRGVQHRARAWGVRVESTANYMLFVAVITGFLWILSNVLEAL